MHRVGVAILGAMLLITGMPAVAGAYVETAEYERREVEGWTVRINPKVLERRELADEVLALLRVKLFEVNRALPARAVGGLRGRVDVWIELADERFPGMCYHPSAGWLRANGYNPDKAGDIEIGNAQNFLSWSRDQPSMVLHELAHAYHDLVLGHDHEAVRGAYERAKESGDYDDVLRNSGRTEKAYAMNNPNEYFAELSEAYFGTNDFYPFVRAELRRHDRRGYEMIRTVWRDRDRVDAATLTTAPASEPATSPVPATRPAQ